MTRIRYPRRCFAGPATSVPATMWAMPRPSRRDTTFSILRALNGQFTWVGGPLT